MATPEQSTKTAKIGMIGLAVMGENLAMNIERNGFPIAVFNRDPAKVDSFVARTQGKQVIPTKSPEEFVRSLERPRKVILLVKAGDPDAYEHIRPIWEAIAARVDDGPCVTYIGPGGAGHFVKMVHNGIEYGDMQLIAEAYD